MTRDRNAIGTAAVILAALAFLVPYLAQAQTSFSASGANFFPAGDENIYDTATSLPIAPGDGDFRGPPAGCDYPLYCAATYGQNAVFCGMYGLSRDNYYNIKLNTPIVCQLTPAARAAGISVPQNGATGYGWVIDTGNKRSTDFPLPCGGKGVVSGVSKWGSDSGTPGGNQLDSGYCQNMTLPPGVSFGTPQQRGGSGTYWPTTLMCPPDSVMTGGINAANKNDSWDGFYCSEIYLPISDSIGVTEKSSNFPAAMSAGQTVSTGTDAKPLAVSVQNTGTDTWVTDEAQAIPSSATGNCQVDTNSDGFPDAPALTVGNASTSCEVTYNAWDTSIPIQHTASSFSVTPSASFPTTQESIVTTVIYVPRICYGSKNQGTYGCDPAYEYYEYANVTRPNVYIGGPSGPVSTYASLYATFILPGQSALAYVSSLTAPSATGTYKEFWTPTIANPPSWTYTSSLSPFEWDVTVGGAPPPPPPPPPATGTLDVYSALSVSSFQVTDRPYTAEVPPQYTSGLFAGHIPSPPNAAYCPSGTVMVGMYSTGYANGGSGPVMANEPLCSPFTSAAEAAVGFGLGSTDYNQQANGGSSSYIDSNVNGAPTSQCNPGEVVNGLDWAKNYQADYGYCQPLTSSKGMTIAWGTKTLVTATAVGQDYYCPPDSLVVQGQNSPGKNDSWGGFYCQQVIVSNLPVPSAWTFPIVPPGSVNPPCPTSNPCTGASGTYPGVLAGDYTINVGPTAAGPSYSLHPPITVTVATARDPYAAFASLLSPFLSIARADTGAGTLTAGGTANFFILWDPLAVMNLTPPTSTGMSFSASAGYSGTITVTNGGGLGSTLNWNVLNLATLPSWVSVSKSSGSIGTGSSDTITVTVNPSGISGTTSTAIVFSGTSDPGAKTLNPQYQSMPITLTASSAVCGNGIVETGEQCDNGASNGACPLSCSASCQLQSCPALPSCAFTASPTTVVPPEGSTLSYSCSNVTACTLTGSDGSSYPVAVDGTTNQASGTQSTVPSANTTYTLNCSGLQAGNPSYEKSYSTTVDVGGTNIHEINP
jgi:hypothetical protein